MIINVMFDNKKPFCIIAVTQLFRIDKEEANRLGRPLGMLFTTVGILYMLFACTRYFHSQTAMTKGYFPSSKTIILITTLVILSAFVAVFIILVSKF